MDYYAKDAATAAYGLQQGAPPNAPATEPPLFTRLVIGAEQLASQTASIEERLHQLLVRAIGPQPQPAGSEQADSPAQGHLGALDLRLTASIRSADRIFALLERIERII